MWCILMLIIAISNILTTNSIGISCLSIRVTESCQCVPNRSLIRVHNRRDAFLEGSCLCRQWGRGLRTIGHISPIKYPIWPEGVKFRGSGKQIFILGVSVHLWEFMHAHARIFEYQYLAQGQRKSEVWQFNTHVHITIN